MTGSFLLRSPDDMNVFLITLGVFLTVLFAMAIGAILVKRPIQGSCGGLASMKDRDGKSICDACAEDPDKRPPDCVRRAAAAPDAAVR